MLNAEIKAGCEKLGLDVRQIYVDEPYDYNDGVAVVVEGLITYGNYQHRYVIPQPDLINLDIKTVLTLHIIRGLHCIKAMIEDNAGSHR